MFINDNDIATFKKYLNVSFTFNTKNKFVGLQEAEEDFVKPILGNSLYTVLKAQILLPSVPDVYKNLLHQCRKVTVPLSIYNNIATKGFIIGDGGIKKTTAADGENLYRWEFKEIENELRDKVSKAVDDLWKYLFANATALSWQNPSKFNTIFKTADDFANVYSLQQPYRIFNLFLPIVSKVEELYLYDVIGEVFYKQLIAVSTPTVLETKAIDLLRQAAAHYTVYCSVNDLNIKITEYGLTVPFGNATDSVQPNEKTATAHQLKLLKEARLADATRFLNRAKKLLNQNASNSVFATYYNSSYYVNPNTVATDYNATRKGIVRL
jgi:hypothetical protein